MDPRQRTKERGRRGSREDRRERGMDYQELGKREMWKIEGWRIRGWEDRRREREISERKMNEMDSKMNMKLKIKDSHEDVKEKDISWHLKVMNWLQCDWIQRMAFTTAAVAIVAQVGRLPWQPHLLAINHLPGAIGMLCADKHCKSLCSQA